MGSVLLGGVLVSSVLAAVGASTVEEYRVVLHLGVEDGLSHSSVYAVEQTADGFVWLATEGGLDRFDGRSVERVASGAASTDGVGIPSASELLEDAERSLWIGGWGYGLVLVDRESGASRSWRREDGLLDDRVQRLLAEPAGRILTGTVGGLQRFSRSGPGTVAASTRGQRIWDLARGHDEDLWVATGEGVQRLAADTLELLDAWGTVGPDALPHAEVRAIHVDAGGEVWAGTRAGLIRRPRDGDSWIAVPIDPGREGGAIGRINVLERSTSGGLWVGTSDGLYLRPADGLSFTAVEALWTRGARGNIRSLCRDRAGVLWVGTREQGVYALESRSLLLERILEEAVEAVVVDPRGDVWAGTRRGLVHFSEGTAVRRYLLDPGGSGDRDIVLSLERDRDGAVWVGSFQGLSRLEPGADAADPASWRPPAEAPAELRRLPIEVLLDDPDGRFWVGSRAGLFAFSPSDALWAPISGGDLPADAFVYALAVETDRRDGSRRLWVGTAGDGLCRVDLGGERPPRCWGAGPEIPQSLADDRVRALLVDPSGTLWVGTELALHRRRGPSSFDRLRRGLELPDGAILGLAAASGRIWVTTNAGLVALDPASEEIRTYGPARGTQGFVYGQGALAAGPDGTLYLGGENGLDRMRGAGEGWSVDAPDAMVTGIAIVGRSIHERSLASPPRSLELGPEDDLVEIELGTRDPARTSGHRIRYRLLGLDDRWTEGREAAYRELPAGSYRFEAQAAAPLGEWSSRSLRLDIEKRPAWWASRSSRVGAAVLGFLVLLGMQRWKLTAERRRAADLQEMVAERTRELERERDRAEHERRKQVLVNEIVKLINAESELEEVLRAVLEGLGFLCGTSRGLALQREPDDSFVEIVRVGWTGSAEVGLRIPRQSIEDLGRSLRPLAPQILVGTGEPGWLAPVDPTAAAALWMRFDLDADEQAVLSVTTDDRRALEELGPTELEDVYAHIFAAFRKARLVERLRRLDRQKSEFLGIAAHDLRSPLGSIGSYADLILRQGRRDAPDWPSIERFAENLKGLSKNMVQLIGDLLDVASIETGRVILRREAFRVASLLETQRELYEHVAQEKGLTLELIPSEERALADPSRSAEALGNLVGNALKFTAPGGRVVVRAARRGDQVEIRVSDTGPGLGPDEVERAFGGGRLGPRPTGGEPSTGFGLRIVRKLVELQGGRVGVESTVGQGSSFWFTLPRADPEEPTSGVR